MKPAQFLLVMLAMSSLLMACGDDSNDSLPQTGQGGSLARFAVSDTHVYVVDRETLFVYQIMPDGGLSKLNHVLIGEGVETIFARDNYLFIGTEQAMMIYDVKLPSQPQLVSNYQHIVSCDPVVVQDTLAFATLPTSRCRLAGENALEVINVKDPSNPRLVSRYTLHSPYGLGVDGELLFVCEGSNGLVVMDISDPFNLKVIARYTSFDAYDVIPHNGILILTGKDGIAQYDYSDSKNIKLISHIPVQKP